MNRFSIDIWCHIASFLKQFNPNGKTLLWLCHNSRLGILRCYPFWAREFPDFVTPFLQLRTEKLEHFGSYCMFIMIEKKKKELNFSRSVAKRRIVNLTSKIQGLQHNLKTEQKRVKKRDRLIDEMGNHFDLNTVMKLSSIEIKKTMKQIKNYYGGSLYL